MPRILVVDDDPDVRAMLRITLERTVKYPEACLELLPEELLQYLFAWITSLPVPHCWFC